MKDYRKLKVWESSHQLVLAIYSATRSFPPEEKFGLTSQLRRAAVSVPSNIVEGCGRGNDGDLRRFCEIAMGSAAEVEYQTLLSFDLNYLDQSGFDQLSEKITQCKRMLHSFITTLRNSNSKSS